MSTSDLLSMRINNNTSGIDALSPSKRTANSRNANNDSTWSRTTPLRSNKIVPTK